jgi:uncharacterized protein
MEISAFVKSKLDAMNYEHTRDVVKIAGKLAELENADKEIVEAAAWLHDVGKSIAREGHPKIGAKIAGEFLKKEGYQEDFIEKVFHCVRVHEGPLMRAFGKEIPEEFMPSTKEAKVLFDADMIAQFSESGIAKQFYYRFGKEKYDFTKGIEEAKKRMKIFRGILFFESAKKMSEQSYAKVVDFFEKIGGIK